jgi:EAL domain-containing protein (putative c-di-GMP-specific phosphodiesterase class I)
MQINVARRLEIEERMVGAPGRGEVTLHYQPVVATDLSAIHGAEALVRWRSPELGCVVPAEFIPIAEETGEILSLGEWVLSEACRQAACWIERGWRLDVHVNVSTRQLRAPDFVEVVKRALADAELAPAALVLEITETCLLDLSSETERSVLALNALGVRLELDDFGMGYSCLAVLKRVPVHALKVDRHFVSGVVGEPADANVITAIVALAHGFGAETIAEGVETSEQLDAIRQLGCERFQGFLFGPALPAPEFEALLRSQDRLLDELRAKLDCP